MSYTEEKTGRRENQTALLQGGQGAGSSDVDISEDLPHDQPSNTWSVVGGDKESNSSFVVPQHPLSHELRRVVPWQMLLGLAAVIAVSCTVSYALVEKDCDCLGGVPRWKPLVVFNLLVLFCVLVVRGVNPELSLLGVSAVAILAGCLDADSLFKGASSSAVVSLALLFPIAKSLANTGLPDWFIGRVMGNPSTVMPGIARMYVALLLPSGVFNNTPIVAMMIPVLQSWSARLGFDVKVMLLPLTYAAQAGGNLTLMGSSINFVAKQIFDSATGGQFTLGFFDLTIGGVILYIVVGAYCALLGPRMLKAPEVAPREVSRQSDVEHGLSAQSMESVEAAEHEPKKWGKCSFRVSLLIRDRSELLGLTATGVGLHRVKGVCTSRLHPPYLERGTERVAQGWDALSAESFQGGDVLIVGATADGIAALRLVPGIELVNEQSEVAKLGAKRRARCLVEASVSNSLVGSAINIVELKKVFRCAVIAVASPDEPDLSRQSYQGYVVRQGDVLVLEAFREDIGSDAWARLFGVVRLVPKSSPPRTGRPTDTVRAIATSIGLLLAVCLTMANDNRLQLTITCVLLLCGLCMIKALTVEEAYAAINSSVLLTIVGALALGQALQEVHLATCFADSVVSLAKPLGKYAILAALYLATFGMGFFVTNAAVVAIMSQIAVVIASDPSHNIGIGEVALVIIYSASACWCTPYGYQTNLMVAKEAGYTWGDFVRFGLPLQAVHLVLTVTISPMCAHVVFG